MGISALVATAIAGTTYVAGKQLYNALTPSNKGPPKPPSAPTEDTAANAANQASDLARKRRGVLANIYAGGQDFKPQVAVKTLLGA